MSGYLQLQEIALMFTPVAPLNYYLIKTNMMSTLLCSLTPIISITLPLVYVWHNYIAKTVFLKKKVKEFSI